MSKRYLLQYIDTDNNQHHHQQQQQQQQDANTSLSRSSNCPGEDGMPGHVTSRTTPPGECWAWHAFSVRLLDPTDYRYRACHTGSLTLCLKAVVLRRYCNMVEWLWWNWSLDDQLASFGALMPLVGWLGHLTCSAIDHYGAASTFHDHTICETRFSVLCISCLELTTENCSQ